MGVFVAVSSKNCISSKKIGYGKCNMDTYRIKGQGQQPIVSVEKGFTQLWWGETLEILVD